ncbi:MAG TPA: hypothetical protein VEH06_05170 [Candidatus Bathyarchaeia archaeon]|nr:hypothetical protein [Candidatus Bathyarchaeia archaeon]
MMLQDFCKYVVDNDPDILASKEHHYQSPVLQRLFARIEEVGLDIQLERGNTNNSNYADGRVYLDSNSVDTVGLIETARFAWFSCSNSSTLVCISAPCLSNS